MFVRIVRGVIVLLVAVMILGYFASKDGTQATASTQEQTAAQAAEEPAAHVNAGKLFRDYQANEVAADNAYTGHKLAVSQYDFR